MNNDAEHLKNCADRIRAKGTQGHYLGHAIIEMVKNNRGRAECFEDCRLIIDSYPQDFPLHGERQAI